MCYAFIKRVFLINQRFSSKQIRLVTIVFVLSTYTSFASCADKGSRELERLRTTALEYTAVMERASENSVNVAHLIAGWETYTKNASLTMIIQKSGILITKPTIIISLEK